MALYVRLRLRETPLFTRLKDAGNSSTSPWRESFGNSANRKLILLALFGMTAGQAVVWYQGQFQALFFLQNTLNVPYQDSYIIVGIAIALATPFFLFFGRLSDRIGRKPIILGGCLIAAITYVPIYILMSEFAGPGTPGTNASGAAIVLHTSPNMIALIALVFIQVVYVTMVYGPIAAFLVEYFPAAHPLHLAVDPVPHRERLVRWLPAADLHGHLGRDGQHLHGPHLPDRCRSHDGLHRLAVREGDASHPHLGRGRRRRGEEGARRHHQRGFDRRRVTRATAARHRGEVRCGPPLLRVRGSPCTIDSDRLRCC